MPMIRSILLAVLLAISGSGLFAQVVHQRAFTNSNTVFARPDIAWSSYDRTFVVGQLETSDTLMYSNRIRIMKLDTTGYPVWTQQLAYSDTSISGVSVTVAPNGMIYCVGYRNTIPTNYLSYFMVCIEPWGQVNWSKIYATESTTPYEGPDVKVLAGGEVLITESVYGHMGYIKTDAAGNVIQSVSIREDTTAENKTPGFASAVLSDGSFLFTGKRDADIALVHTDNTGNILWSSLWNTGSYYHAKNITPLSDGSSIVCGMDISYYPFLMRVDANGSQVWYEQFTERGIFYDVQQADDSTFLASGDIQENNEYSAMITRFDGDGNILQTIKLPGNNTSRLYIGSRMLINPNGLIAFGGCFGATSTSLTSNYFMTMDQLTTSGCEFTNATLTVSTTAQDPSLIAMPLYSIQQNITVTNEMPVITNAVQNYINFCWVVSNDDHELPGTEMQVYGSVIHQGGELSFSLGNYTGEYTYSVYDQLGREILNRKGNCSASERIMLPEEATRVAGVYSIVVNTSKSRISEKFVVY